MWPPCHGGGWSSGAGGDVFVEPRVGELVEAWERRKTWGAVEGVKGFRVKKTWEISRWGRKKKKRAEIEGGSCSQLKPCIKCLLKFD